MSKLFSTIALGNLNLTNRVMVAPMCQYSGIDGKAQPWHEQHIGQLVCSGAGAVTMEATAVEPNGMITYGCLGLWNQSQEDVLRQLLNRLRTYSSSPIGIQLNHAGRKASAHPPWKGGKPLDQQDGWASFAPSSIPWGEGWPLPEYLTTERMQEINNAFVDSAKRAERVGFNYIELHCAHGYLLHSFLSQISNQREDEYGGSRANRMKYPLRVLQSVRNTLNKDTVLGVRINGTDWLEEGWQLEDAVVFAKQLEELGINYVSVSSGGACGGVAYPKEEAYQVELASRIRSELQIPVICAGLINDPHNANVIVEEGKADIIALARAVLHNPKWPHMAARMLGTPLEQPRQHWAVVPEAWPFLNGTLKP